MSQRANIGVVGLGIIGRRIAAHLRRKNFPVYVWNRSPRPVPNFVGSLGELAELCKYIQIFVSDDNALIRTIEQLSEKLTPRHAVLAHSTVAPDSMRAAAEIVEHRGAQFIEATFTGSKGAAEKGELVYYVGGTEQALREARPILEASSKEILYIGAIGQASAVKIATNMITAATVEAAAEALALIQAQGLPLEKFLEAMRANASYSGTLAMKLPNMIERDFQPHFSVKHMLKDVELASQIALSHFLDLRVTAAARDQLVEQTQWGHGEDDDSAVLRKYLHEPAPGFHEQPQPEEPGEQPDADESIYSAQPETQSLAAPEPGIVASQEPLLNLSGAVGAVPATAPLRRGLLKQLLSRFSPGRE
jgi:3-hydroxyisobutyrate dehydrogenase-like beta-hydroxyacid dehydrogenase